MDDLQQQMFFTAASLLCSGIGAVHDLRERRIPNRLTLPAMVGGLTLHGIAGGPREMATAALAGLIAGSLFLVFFLAGGMGAGDVKLMAAVGCIAGMQQVFLVLVAIALAGGIFAIALSLYNGCVRQTLRNVGALVGHHLRAGLAPHPDLNLANPRALRLPFALPIAAGCLLAVCARALEAYQ